MLFFHKQAEDAWLWVPILAQRPILVSRSHLLGHFGLSSTMSRLLQAYRATWPAMAEDVAACIATCAACITRLPSAPIHHPAIALPIPGVFHRVAMDLALGFPMAARQNIGVLVIMEYLTKFPVLYPIKSKKAEEIAGHFTNFVCMMGTPNELLSDQGGEFVNEILNSLCTRLGIEKRLTSSYSPATNGMVERFNRTLLRSLETHAANHPEDWDQSLDYVAMSFRTRVHSATGSTPFELMFGRPANLFSTALPVLAADSCNTESLLLRSDEIKELFEFTIPKTVKSLQLYQEHQMKTQDKAVTVRKDPLPKGSVVFCRNLMQQKKMQNHFLGPYRVHEITSQGLYKLVNRHGIMLKKAFPLDQLKEIAPEFAEEIWEKSKIQVFSVNAIIDHRNRAGGIEYLVEWRGFDEEHNTWVMAVDILDHDLIAVYEALPRNPGSTPGPSSD